MFNSVINFQFNYCPPLLMFCSRTSNSMINKLHQRSLTIALNHYSVDLNGLLKHNNDIWNNRRNIQTNGVNVNPKELSEVFKVYKRSRLLSSGKA